MVTYDYDYIYKNLSIRGYTLDFLRKEKILSQSSIQRLRHNDPISTSTIDTLCVLLECQPQDFIRHSRNESDLFFINSLEEKIYGRIVTKGTTSEDNHKWEKTIDLRRRE